MTDERQTPARAASLWGRLLLQEDLNFLLTNRIPRRWATLFMGWYSRIDSPRLTRLTRLTLRLWRLFADDLDLTEARSGEFRSLRDLFIRELRPGARPIDPDPEVVVSPSSPMPTPSPAFSTAPALLLRPAAVVAALLGLMAVRFLMPRLTRASPRAPDPAKISRRRAPRCSPGRSVLTRALKFPLKNA